MFQGYWIVQPAQIALLNKSNINFEYFALQNLFYILYGNMIFDVYTFSFSLTTFIDSLFFISCKKGDSSGLEHKMHVK